MIPNSFEAFKQLILSYFQRCNKCQSRHCTQHDDDGKWLCAECYDQLCPHCNVSLGEIETSKGDYICTDCHAGEIDHLYDQARDEGFHSREN